VAICAETDMAAEPISHRKELDLIRLIFSILLPENKIPATAENERRKPGWNIKSGEKGKIIMAAAANTLNGCFLNLKTPANEPIASMIAALTTDGQSPVTNAYTQSKGTDKIVKCLLRSFTNPQIDINQRNPW
jgi:hypothetical protein